MANRVYVLVDSYDIIVAASVDDGTKHALNFLQPVPSHLTLHHIAGPVRLNARLNAPMVWPVSPSLEADRQAFLMDSRDCADELEAALAAVSPAEPRATLEQLIEELQTLHRWNHVDQPIMAQFVDADDLDAVLNRATLRSSSPSPAEEP